MPQLQLQLQLQPELYHNENYNYNYTTATATTTTTLHCTYYWLLVNIVKDVKIGLPLPWFAASSTSSWEKPCKKKTAIF